MKYIMEAPFKKLGCAVTFSPTGRALLSEAKRLKDLLRAELFLIHVGVKDMGSEIKLNELITSAELNKESTYVEWIDGEVAKSIIKKCKEKKVDLLIAGALEKENIFQYYIGSVARKLMRDAPCSLLIFTNPSEQTRKMNKFCATIEYTSAGEETVRKAYELARLENAEELILIREFQVPGLAMTVQDSGSLREAEESIQQWKKEEMDKMLVFVKEMNLEDINVETVCLYGKQGWESSRYVAEIKGDVLAVPAPRKKLKILDRIFQHDLEFILKQMPCSVLLIKDSGS